FMAALLTSERANTDKMVSYIGECKDMGIRVLPPDVCESGMFFSVVPGPDAPPPIRFGLAAIKNVGEGAVEAVLTARRRDGAFKAIFHFLEGVGPRSLKP